VIVLGCPTGCGPIRRPYHRRTEAVRCPNCTAWFAASPLAEDRTVVEGILQARPGDALALAGPAPPRLTRVVLVCLFALALAVLLVLAGRALAA
jgi:hypothetical protein